MKRSVYDEKRYILIPLYVVLPTGWFPYSKYAKSNRSARSECVNWKREFNENYVPTLTVQRKKTVHRGLENCRCLYANANAISVLMYTTIRSTWIPRGTCWKIYNGSHAKRRIFKQRENWRFSEHTLIRMNFPRSQSCRGKLSLFIAETNAIDRQQLQLTALNKQCSSKRESQTQNFHIEVQPKRFLFVSAQFQHYSAEEGLSGTLLLSCVVMMIHIKSVFAGALVNRIDPNRCRGCNVEIDLCNHRNVCCIRWFYFFDGRTFRFCSVWVFFIDLFQVSAAAPVVSVWSSS